ncbi:AAA family ATPase [Desulfococcus multivorans]|jgi:predicted ATPase|uniref:AAA family ATPase n=2 Tax=Desulfococcus multivorans TaxID=897 RepID=UPI0008A71293|nr:AAA family ATPase [Desulfococcus multivorans]AOY60541.1 putative ABC transporter, ATP-binding protein [Desulfococcus multivorans]AQV02633.1 ABC transporter ATP-binding protein [Desulfococcus multivorans]SKA24811.1 Predicted ATPase [Desulfococcus multivorans DSM 2059]
MYKINRIKIGGFRRLLKVDLPVRPFMVLIGANGVGKTSFLDALSILSASASSNLNSMLSQFGGIANLLTRGKSEDLSFLVDMTVPGHEPLEYELRLAPKGTGYSISRELLSQKRQGFNNPFRHIESSDGDIRYYETEENRLVRPDWEHNPLETSLSQVPKMFRQPEELRRILATATQYHVLDVGPRAPVKMPQPMKPATLPGPDGGDLVPYLYYLREVDRERFEIIIDSLRAAFQDFEELSFPPVAAGMLAMTWKDKQFNKPIYMNELSEGTLRFLWLVSLLQSPNLSTITMIDEPEVSLHPELLSLLADLMREASKRTQLIVATHSDRFIRFLNPDEVVVMDVDDDGCATATWADSMDLDQWLAEYSLDEVWRMGRMGGRS